MDKDIRLNVTAENGAVITVLTGAAPLPPELPKKVQIAGTLDAPADFYALRFKEAIPFDTRVEFNYAAGTILLIVGENMATNTTVEGSIRYNEEFNELGINGNKIYSLKTLREVLKFKGRYFESKEKHRELISNLVNFSAKIERDFSNSNDFKGNAATQVVTKLQTEIPLNFKIKMPVLLGYPDFEIEVDVQVDATTGDLKLWLESVDIDTTIKTTIADIMEKKKEVFKDKIVIITTG